MALNWNQEITLSSIKNLFKGGKKGSAQVTTDYPTKTTMNLYQVDPKSTNLRTLVLAGILGLLCLVAFVKFGILDQFARVSQKEAELATQQQMVMSMMGSMEGYDAVKEEYDGFVARYGDAPVDAIAVLDMVEQRVKPHATVTAIVLSDTTLTLTLRDVPLNTVGDLAKDLEGQPLVDKVNVQTASTQHDEGQNTVATLVVTLKGTSGKEA